MKKYKFWIIGVIIIVIAGGFFWRNKNKGIKVESAEITRGEIQRVIRASGKLFNDDSDRVFAPLAGRVENLPKTDGEWVGAGEEILRYETSSLAVAIEQAISNLEAAKKTEEDIIRSAPSAAKIQAAVDLVSAKKIIYDQAQTDYAGDPTPANRQNLNTTLVAWREAVAALEALEKTAPTGLALSSVKQAVEAAELSLKNARENLDKAIIIAPQAGILIYESSVAVPKIGSGSTTAQGQWIFTVSDPEKLKFAAEIDEADIDRINQDQKIEIELKAIDEVLAGKIVSIDQKMTVTDSGAEVFLVRLELSGTKARKDFRTGMKGEAIFVLQAKPNVLKVPIEAVFEEEGKNIVYINDNGLAKKINIEIGIENEEHYEVKSGLKEGDQVLVGSNMNDVEGGIKIKLD